MLKFITRYPYLIPALAVLVYLLAIPVDIMEIDSAQYAHMARELIDRGDYLHFYDRGIAYLDKPPLIFWLSALFYQWLGVNELAFKLPSILFSIGGIYAVYRFTRLYYDQQTAALAAAILATTQGYFHFNNDVRTDTYLTNSVMMAVWMLAEFLEKKSWYWWLGGFALIGVAMLAKGPIGLMVPILAFSTHFILKGSWHNFLKWQWLAGTGVILLVLSPMMIGLYEQFDQHPENWVNGRQGVSGLRFFFWEQSFGRITGENVWKNDAGPFFFVHNIAWSFMPWTIPLFAGLTHLLTQVIRHRSLRLPERNEWISTGGFVLPFMALSASQFKLPHYIYVVFPFAAIIASDWMLRVYKAQGNKVLYWIQLVLMVSCWLLAGVLFVWAFPLQNGLLILLTLLTLLGFIWILFQKSFPYFERFLMLSLLSILSLNVLLALHFYPAILSYQAPGMIAQSFDKLKIEPDRVYNLGVECRSMDFYARRITPDIQFSQVDSILKARKYIYVLTGPEGLAEIEKSKFRGTVLLSREHFSITLLSLPFLNPASRSSVTKMRYLVRLPN